MLHEKICVKLDSLETRITADLLALFKFCERYQNKKFISFQINQIVEFLTVEGAIHKTGIEVSTVHSTSETLCTRSSPCPPRLPVYDSNCASVGFECYREAGSLTPLCGRKAAARRGNFHSERRSLRWTQAPAILTTEIKIDALFY